MSLRPAIALVLAGALLAGVWGCGKKEEPDLAGLPQAQQPLPLGDALALISEQDGAAALPIAGTWRGELRQAGTRPFPIRVTIESLTDATRNRVRYGGAIDCSGTWRFTGGRGAEARFIEVIGSGDGGRCKGRGLVTLTSAPGGRLGYRFQGGGVSSRGTLRRAAPQGQ